MILEVRTYRLKAGATDEFVRLMRDHAVRLLETFGVRVVRCGASLVAEDGRRDAFLIRAFGSVEERDEQEERFYGSDAWRHGPREAILALIESYHTAVLEVPAELAPLAGADEPVITTQPDATNQDHPGS
ncbi:MAG TPA: NIPSNAP family protein [Jiangellaceae bacterium]